MYEQATRLLGLEGLVVTALRSGARSLSSRSSCSRARAAARPADGRVAKRLDASRYPPSA